MLFIISYVFVVMDRTIEALQATRVRSRRGHRQDIRVHTVITGKKTSSPSPRVKPPHNCDNLVIYKVISFTQVQPREGT